jgi:O-antigen/teichoic acid export membrane protein
MRTATSQATTAGLTFYRRSAREFGLVAAGQLVALVATAIGTKILTTQLGNVEYGRLTLGLTLATLLGQSIYGPFISALARLWSPYVETGHAGDLRAATDRLVGWITLPLLVVGVAVAVFLYVQGQVAASVLVVGAVSFGVFQNVFAVYNSIETANRRRGWAALFQTIAQVARIGFGVGAVLLVGASSAVAAVGLAIGIMVVLVAQHGSLSPTAAQPVSDTRGAFDELWRYGRYFLGWGALGGIQLVSDVWALKFFTSDAVVGVYGLASLIAASTIAAIGGVLTQFVYPIAFQRAGTGRSADRVQPAIRLVREVAGGMTGLTIVALVFVLAFGSQLVEIVSAPGFAAASALLPPIILAAGLQQTANLLGLVPMIVADMRRYLVVRMATTVLSIVLNVTGAWLAGVGGLLTALILGGFVYLVAVLWIQTRAVGRLDRDLPGVGPRGGSEVVQ